MIRLSGCRAILSLPLTRLEGQGEAQVIFLGLMAASAGHLLLLPAPSCIHGGSVCSYLPVPTLNLLRICLHLSLPAGACPHLGISALLPQAWGSQGDSHDAAQSPDVRLAGMSVSGHYLRSQEVWGPAEHSGGITGAQEDWGPPHQTRPTCTHPESRLRACSHLRQRPPGPILVASPRSPIFTSMFLFRKKLPCGRGRSGQ